MALPKLNDTPKYTLTVPSTGQELKYRPYLVKEEKVLLMASASEDTRQIMDAVHDTIVACVEGVDVSKLTTFDLEYIFIQLRCKSTGENSQINVRCPSCDERNLVNVPLHKIECTKSNQDPMIRISDNIVVEMKYPSYHDVPADMQSNEMGFGFLAASIKSVISGDEKINVEDEPYESVIAFLESMTQEQFLLVTSFFEDAPTVKYDLDMTCTECEAMNVIEIKGMNSFF